MTPSTTCCLPFLLTILLAAATRASPINAAPQPRHHLDNHHADNLYATSDMPHVSKYSHTRDESHTPPHAFKRSKPPHPRRDMGADDLKRAARQSRREHETSREQPSNTNTWLTSLTKLFGIAVNEQHNENSAAADTSDDNSNASFETHGSQQSATRLVEPAAPKQRFDVDAHHPADFGSEEEIHTSSTEADTDADRDSRASLLDDDQLISKTDLQDLVRLFRRMFTTLEQELNHSSTSAQPPQQRSANDDLNAALAQAQALNRKKDLERNSVLAQDADDDSEREEEDADHENAPDLPVGSPAYESRKRIMRGLSGVVESDRAQRRRVARYKRAPRGDREHFSKAMSAGLLPYL